MRQHQQQHERVRQLAERLWIEAGRPEGRDEEFWHEAERQIRSEAPDPPAGPESENIR